MIVVRTFPMIITVAAADVFPMRDERPNLSMGARALNVGQSPPKAIVDTAIRAGI